MIRYEVRCEAGHAFEGWFRSSAGFEAQRDAGEIACPTCGSATVDRAPMAPAVARSAPVPSDAQMKHMLRAMRQAVETNCEHVGDRFAEEARKIHYGETEPRGIYGDATKAESEALADEGIPVATIPWIEATDS
jgi:hypothetical protein